MNEQTSDTVLDQHAAALALSLHRHGIESRVETSATNHPETPVEHWLCFDINGHEFWYKRGELIDPNKPGRGSLGLNINHQAGILVADKQATKEHLCSLGFSVPQGQKFRRRDMQKARDYYRQQAGPLCVKPNSGSLGSCVTTAISCVEQYQKALELVAKNYVSILVEESVVGDHFRFFYVEPYVIGIRQGIPLSVVGDGTQTIAGLLDMKNLQREKRNLVTHPAVPIDAQMLDFLKLQGLTPEHILPANKRVFLRASAGRSAAADSILIDTNDIHPDYLEIVSAACQSVPGLHYSGVDIIIKDKHQSASNDNHWLIELNANPGIAAFYHPWQGKTVDVGGYLVDLLGRYPF
jgi:D-alanine-D-alanine ligase-like ATP-grasp enzyme